MNNNYAYNPSNLFSRAIGLNTSRDRISPSQNWGISEIIKNWINDQSMIYKNGERMCDFLGLFVFIVV